MNEAQKYALFDKNKKNFGRAASGALRPCVGLSAPSPSRRSAASVVPLLSLSHALRAFAPSAQNFAKCRYPEKARLGQIHKILARRPKILGSRPKVLAFRPKVLAQRAKVLGCRPKRLGQRPKNICI